MADKKKVIDTWKLKTWYSVLAPKFLGEVELAKTPASDEDKLLNRVIILPLKEVTRDIAHIYTNIKLRVFEIKGKTAFTKFIGHEVSREYLSTLVRRHRDALHCVYPVKSKDGVEFTIKVLVVTAVPCSNTQKTSLRNALKKELVAKVAATDFGRYINEALYGRLGAELSQKLKRIAPIRRIEIKKTQLKEEFDTDAVEKIEGESESEGAEEAKPA